MKIISYPEVIECPSCGAKLGEITEKDLKTFHRVEDKGIFILPVYGCYKYKGIQCPCCSYEILFEKTRKLS